MNTGEMSRQTSYQQTNTQTQAWQPNKKMIGRKCRQTLAAYVAKTSLSSNGNNAKDNMNLKTT